MHRKKLSEAWWWFRVAHSKSKSSHHHPSASIGKRNLTVYEKNKYPLQLSTNNKFAYPYCQNLDEALEAKYHETGREFGTGKLKIGFGKPRKNAVLWIGGLGPWTSVDSLTREFDRYGMIDKIEYEQGSMQVGNSVIRILAFLLIFMNFFNTSTNQISLDLLTTHTQRVTDTAWRIIIA